MALLAVTTPAYLGFSFWITLILIAVLFGALQGTCAYLILLERKIAAWTQDRVGPNRVGPLGLLQPIADGIKFLFKEEIIPTNVDKLFYLLAPGIAVSTAMLAIAVVPFGETSTPPQRPWMQTVQQEQKWRSDYPEGAKKFDQELVNYNNDVQFVIAPHTDIGIVFVFAIGSLAAYAIVLGGWSSNNKYSLLGALRSSAQLISYEIPMGMSILGVAFLAGSLNLEKIIASQHAGGWNVLFQPLACLLFITSIFAECNRLPFDLPEAEQELVGGYHTEYGAMKFALFFLGEYTHMITTSFLVVTVFFGGWLLPGVTEPGQWAPIAKLLVFAAKMFLFIVFYMIIRWTIPRFRFDQLMGLAWKVLIPLATVNLIVLLVIRFYLPDSPPWLMLPASLLILIGAGLFALVLPNPPSKAALNVRGHGTGNPLVSRYQPTVLR
jgi:NADH-quinone oxidoreductase subunit H